MPETQSKTNFGPNLAKALIGLHQKFDEKLEKEANQLLEGVEKLSKDLEDFTNLRMRLLKAKETAPRSLDFSNDARMKTVIDRLSEMTGGAINYKKDYRFNEDELKTFSEQLDLLTHRMQNQSNNQMLLLQPSLLKLLDMARMAHESLKSEHEGCQTIIRNMRP